MANILTKYLGKRIFYVFEEHHNEEPHTSKKLCELKGKILIKTDSKLKELMMFFRNHEQPKKNSIQLKLPSDPPSFPRLEFQERF